VLATPVIRKLAGRTPPNRIHLRDFIRKRLEPASLLVMHVRHANAELVFSRRRGRSGVRG
jgi:hypothetical protein